VRNFRRLRPAEKLHRFAVTAVELPGLGGYQSTLLLGKCDDLRSIRKRAVMRVRRRGGIYGLEINLELKIKLRLHDRCPPRLVKLNLGRVPGAFELLQ